MYVKMLKFFFREWLPNKDLKKSLILDFKCFILYVLQVKKESLLFKERKETIFFCFFMMPLKENKLFTPFHLDLLYNNIY